MESTTTVVSDEQAVIAAYTEAYDAFWAAAQAPNDPELRRRLAERRSGLNLESAIAVLDRYVLSERRVVENAAVPHGFEVESVTVGGDMASITVCAINSWVLVEGSASSVVDDSVAITLDHYDLMWDSDRWMINDGVVLEELSTTDGCP